MNNCNISQQNQQDLQNYINNLDKKIKKIKDNKVPGIKKFISTDQLNQLKININKEEIKTIQQQKPYTLIKETDIKGNNEQFKLYIDIQGISLNDQEKKLQEQINYDEWIGSKQKFRSFAKGIDGKEQKYFEIQIKNVKQKLLEVEVKNTIGLQQQQKRLSILNTNQKQLSISQNNRMFNHKLFLQKRNYSLNQECSILNMVNYNFDEIIYQSNKGYDIINIQIQGKEQYEIYEDMEKLKPKDFFEKYSLNLKSLQFLPEPEDNNIPDKFYLDILNGLKKGIKITQNSKIKDQNLTYDTCSIPMNYLNFSNCQDIPDNIIQEFVELLILDSDDLEQEKKQIEEIQQEGINQTQQDKNQDYIQIAKNQLFLLKQLYNNRFVSISSEMELKNLNYKTGSIQNLNKDYFIKIDKIIIENKSVNTKPNVIGNIISSVGWAAGPYLDKIELGNLELDSYSQELSNNYKEVNKFLLKLRKIHLAPTELKLNEIENFPKEFVKTFITEGQNGRCLKIINGQAMFYDLQQMFIEMIKSNMAYQFLLESFIFHYKSCFGIGVEDRMKLINSLTFKGVKKKLKYIDIKDLDEIKNMDKNQMQKELNRRKNKQLLKDEEKDLKKIIEINEKQKDEFEINQNKYVQQIQRKREWIDVKKIDLCRGDVTNDQAKKILKLNEELNLYRVEFKQFIQRKQNIIDCFINISDKSEENQEQIQFLVKNYKDAIIKQYSQKNSIDEENGFQTSYIFDHMMFQEKQGQGPWQLSLIKCSKQEYLENKLKNDEILYKYSKDGREEKIQIRMVCNEYPYVEEFCQALKSRFQKNKLKIQDKIQINNIKQKNVQQKDNKEKSLKPQNIFQTIHQNQMNLFNSMIKKANNKSKKTYKKYDTMMKCILVGEIPPTKLYIDNQFTDEFLLGCLGIYPDNQSKYSYFLNQGFFKICENPKIKLKTQEIHFIPNIIDPKFEVLGGNDLNYIFKIYKYIKMTNIGIVYLNYSYISSDPLKQMAKLSLRVAKNKQQRKNELNKGKRQISQQIKSSKNQDEIFELRLQKKLIKKNIKSLEDDFIQPPNSERELIELFSIIPPSKIEIKNLSINALKLLYVISYENPNFQSAIIEYDSQALVNNGVAYSLQKYFITPQMSNQGTKKIKHIIKTIFKTIFGLFVSKDVIYKFDQSVISLNNFLDLNKRYYISMMVMILVYWFIGSFCPIYFTYKDGIIEEKNRGVSWTSHIIWAIFFFVTIVMETYLYVMTLKKMGHLTPSLKLTPGDGVATNAINKVKKIIINLKWFNYQYLLYGKNLWRSQNARFDFYSDVSFVVACIQNDFYDLTILSASVLILTMLNNVIAYLLIIKDAYRDRNKPKLGTYHINKFYESAVFLEFVALGDVLDIVSPYNVVCIPNNRFTRFFLPAYCGQSISRKMINTALRIFLEDIPQIILQSIFMSRTTDENYMIWIGFGSSLLSIVDSIGIFLSTRPSIITQMDFDKLSYRRQAEKDKDYNKFKKDQSFMFQQIRKSSNQQTGTIDDEDIIIN